MLPEKADFAKEPTAISLEEWQMSIDGAGWTRRVLLPAVVLASACGSLGAGEDEFAEVPAGASLAIQLDQAVSTRSTSVGMAISGSTTQPIIDKEGVLIPEGSPVRGVVTAISKDPPVLSASFNEIEIGGEPYPLEASLTGARMMVRSEMKDEAAKIGGGAAAGAVLGGVIGGDVKGAAIGAAAGAAAGTGVALATKESWAFLAAGSQVAVRLDSSLRLPVIGAEPSDHVAVEGE